MIEGRRKKKRLGMDGGRRVGREGGEDGNVGIEAVEPKGIRTAELYIRRHVGPVFGSP